MSALPGLLLFAHGARDPNWAVPFHDTAARVKASRPGVPVVLAFLEFMSPDLLAAGRALAADGCTAVAVVPLFLGAGGHVRKDLPALLGQLRDEFPQVAWTLAPAVGEHHSVVAAMAACAVEALPPGV